MRRQDLAYLVNEVDCHGPMVEWIAHVTQVYYM